MDLLRHDTLSEEEQQNIGVRRFCACSMLVQAAVGGMGVAMGRTSMIAQEPEQGTLVPLFDRWVTAPARYLFVITPSSRRKPVVQEFSDWVLGQAADASRAHGPLRRGTALR